MYLMCSDHAMKQFYHMKSSKFTSRSLLECDQENVDVSQISLNHEKDHDTQSNRID
jgi:hypothetical protein